MENKHIIGIGALLISIVIVLLFFIPRTEDQGFDESSVDLNVGDFSRGVQNIPDITELQGEDLKVGTGSAVVKAGDTIVVHYTGSFLDGKVFDSSVERGQPFTVVIGAGQVIPGFDQGVLGMKVGGTRKILIPSELAYGAQGQGSIPPNTDIQFQIELLDIKIPPTPTSLPTPEPEPEEEENNEEENNEENNEDNNEEEN